MLRAVNASMTSDPKLERQNRIPHGTDMGLNGCQRAPIQLQNLENLKLMATKWRRFSKSQTNPSLAWSTAAFLFLTEKYSITYQLTIAVIWNTAHWKISRSKGRPNMKYPPSIRQECPPHLLETPLKREPLGFAPSCSLSTSIYWK